MNSFAMYALLALSLVLAGAAGHRVFLGIRDILGFSTDRHRRATAKFEMGFVFASLAAFWACVGFWVGGY